MVVEGSISNFINPHSTKSVTNIIITLYSAKDSEFTISTLPMRLSDFKETSINCTITSSSSVYGAKNVKFTLTLVPHTKLTSEGKVLLTIPEYFEGAGDEKILPVSSPPTTLVDGTVLSSKYNQRLGQLEIQYEFDDGIDRGGEIVFIISKFNNPIEDNMGGFSVETLDDEEYSVGRSKGDVIISGVNIATAFQSYDFNYVGTNCSG